MMKHFIKDFGIIICYIYIYCKLMKIKRDRPQMFIISINSFLLALVASVFDEYLPYITIPMLFIVLYLYVYKTIDKNNLNCFIRCVVVFSINYILFHIAALISVLILLPFWDFNRKPYDQILCLLVQLLIIRLIPIYNSKKIEKILNNKNYVITGLAISFVIIYLSIILNVKNFNTYYIMFESIFFLATIIIFIYWRTSIAKQYLDSLNLRNFKSLNAELTEKNNLIEKLREDNEYLKRVNHKNNKLVPAMREAVELYSHSMIAYVDKFKNEFNINDLESGKMLSDYIEEGNRLLEELKQLEDEWRTLADEGTADDIKEIPVSGVTRVDYIIRYMYSRAENENIAFKVSLDCNVTEMMERTIVEEDLATLIADLVENAIIATKDKNGRDILVSIGLMKKDYTIEIFDSGISFDREVLMKYGREQFTTHGDNGGSGIGMMQTYEILSKCGASLFIDEFSGEDGLYTKKVSVVFNRKHQYVLYTNRSDEDIAYLRKRADLTVVKK